MWNVEVIDNAASLKRMLVFKKFTGVERREKTNLSDSQKYN